MPKGLHVQKVLRVENPRLWDAYSRKRQELALASHGRQGIPIGTNQNARSRTAQMMLTMPRDTVAFKSSQGLFGDANEHYLFHGMCC